MDEYLSFSNLRRYRGQMMRNVIHSAGLVLILAASLQAAPAPVAIVQAAKNADAARIRQLIKNRVDVNAPEIDGTTALHWAVRLSDVATAELPIRAGTDVKTANRYGVSPFSVACTNGNAAMVKLLLEAGADANTTLPGGETALMSVARTGSIDAVSAL